MFLECYNHSTLEVKHTSADSLAIKGIDTPVMLYDMVNGSVVIDTANYTAGEYQVQFFKGDEVLGQTTLKVKQNLKYVAQDYSPISTNKRILEAINAYLAGRASSQQKEVSVGDKKIIYSSFDELIKWKEYYEKEVRKEQGKPSQLRFEKLFYRGV